MNELCNHHSNKDCDVMVWIVQICSPCLLVFGTAGCLMTAALCCRLKLQPGMAVYFTALAMSDLAVLIFDLLLFTWLPVQFNLHFDGQHFQIETIASVSNALSSWFLIALTAQRTLCVIFPYRIRALCTHKTSVVVVCGVSLIILSIYCFEFLRPTESHPTHNATDWELDDDCRWKSSFIQKYYVMRSLSDIIITSLVPSALVIVFNCMLLTRVLKLARRARTNLTAGQADRPSVWEKRASSLTITLITVSITFLLLTAPDNVFTLAPLLKMKFNFSFDIYTILHLLHISNSVIHFYLYCLTGNKFRAEMRKFVSCCRNLLLSN